MHISAVNMTGAVRTLEGWADADAHKYVCVTGVHGVMESQRDAQLRRIHNASGLTTPDGMPMVWSGRYAGASWMERVYGPDLMLAVCDRAVERGWRSFFYGGGDGVPERLAARLSARFPGLQVAGTLSPPFRALSPAEDDDIVETINASGADIVWVGLSTPKQERWMAAHVGRLDAFALIGVGAAFDFHAGLVKQAPVWIQRSGFEWFYRLVQQPRRLWKRYLHNNPRFVARVLRRPPQLLAAGS